MVINVEVRFFGTFQRLSGKELFQMKLEEPATIRKVIMKLSETFSSEFSRALLDLKLDDPRPNSLILVGGKEISAVQGLETMVKDSEEVVLVPVAHGG
jgi:molybdopterin converting factor small subunit